MAEENKRKGDSEAKKKWVKENTFFIGMKLNKHTDADIFEYLHGKPNQTEIKKILKEYIAQKNRENNQ